MAKSNMNQDILKVLLSEEQIHARIQEMGDELFDRFKDRNPMFVGVLNGCFMFMADLVRATQLKSEVEFISFVLLQKRYQELRCGGDHPGSAAGYYRSGHHRGGGYPGLRQHPGLPEKLPDGQGGQEHFHRDAAG